MVIILQKLLEEVVTLLRTKGVRDHFRIGFSIRGCCTGTGLTAGRTFRPLKVARTFR
ncbi:MAG: hypothetical protein V4503_13145 [Gemmatimonadota bacterium]